MIIGVIVVISGTTTAKIANQRDMEIATAWADQSDARSLGARLRLLEKC